MFNHWLDDHHHWLRPLWRCDHHGAGIMAKGQERMVLQAPVWELAWNSGETPIIPYPLPLVPSSDMMFPWFLQMNNRLNRPNTKPQVFLRCCFVQGGRELWESQWFSVAWSLGDDALIIFNSPIGHSTFPAFVNEQVWKHITVAAMVPKMVVSPKTSMALWMANFPFLKKSSSYGGYPHW